MAIPHDLFSRSLHVAMVVRAGRRDRPFHAPSQPPASPHDGTFMAPCQQEKGNCLIMLCLDTKFFSFAFSFRYFAYVLWFLMLKHFYRISICVCICMCFRCSFFDSSICFILSNFVGFIYILLSQVSRDPIPHTCPLASSVDGLLGSIRDK